MVHRSRRHQNWTIWVPLRIALLSWRPANTRRSRWWFGLGGAWQVTMRPGAGDGGVQVAAGLADAGAGVGDPVQDVDGGGGGQGRGGGGLAGGGGRRRRRPGPGLRWGGGAAAPGG